MTSSSQIFFDASDFVLQGQNGLQQAPPPPDGVQTLPELFAHTALKYPQRPALSCSLESGSFQTLSYSDVATKVDQMSNTLRTVLGAASDIAPQEDVPPVVGIWFERSLDLTLAILTATTAGSTWLPFDPDAPIDRVRACLADSGTTLLLCDDAHYDRACHLLQSGQTFRVTRFNELTASKSFRHPRSSSGLQRPIRAVDPAYLIYTSGTTGTPKGICIPHSAALTFLLSESSVLGITEYDTVWQGFSPAFDMWIEETWVSFCRGAHVIVGTREECRDTSQLGTIWKARKISVVHAVPTLMSIVVMDAPYGDSIPKSVRLINLGGEACPASLVKKLAYPGRRLINTYGPTETTVSATWAELTPDESVTIGRPLPSYHAILLRDDITDKAEPIKWRSGSTGELAVGGPCVGLGYVNREELTAKKFVEHPLYAGERIYRTGDLVSLDHEGSLRFLRRIDTQVKLRGFRIELGEIEECLNAQPGVRTSAVILSSLGPDDTNTCLEAYVVLDPDCSFNPTEMRQGLTSLPSYMHPERFLPLSKDEVPRLASGKISVQGLHAMSIERRRRETISSSSATICRPTHLGDVKELTSLNILFISLHSLFPTHDSISSDADFFLDLGGHSLLAAIFVSGLRKGEPGFPNPFTNLGLSDLYALRTPRALSEHFPLEVAEHRNDDDDIPHQSLSHVTTPRWQYIACNIAQFPCLIFIWFLLSLQGLVPYYVFSVLAREHVGLGILAAFGSLVIVPFFTALIALAAKWILLGRVTEGEHRLWGWFYLRWWFVERLSSFIPVSTIAGTPLFAIWLRLLGAKIGRNVNLRELHVGSCADLLSIGDNVVTEADCIFGLSFVEGGMLKLRKISVGDDAHLGAQCVLDGQSRVEDAAELGSLSMVPSGCTIPSGERWIGCPARFDSHLPPLPECKTGGHIRNSLLMLGYLFSTFFMLPLFYFIPQIPGLLLFEYFQIRIHGQYHPFVQTAFIAPVVAIAYVLLVAIELFVFRWALLGKVKPGRYSTSSLFYFRRWFVDRLMDISLGILRSVYATIYVPYFLRALGVTIGRRAEVSTARNMTHDLVEIGEESFIADMVLIGDAEVRRGELILKRTKMDRRAFAGNACVIPQGSQLAENTLVGVLSIAPPLDQPLQSGETSFGSPPVLLPVRQKFDQYDERLTFRPSGLRRAARGTVEAFRIFFPRIAIVYGLGICLNIITDLQNRWHFSVVSILCLLPAYYFFFFALPALVVSVACKWLIIGVYKKSEWPMWDHRVWFSEAVTAINESLADPVLLSNLRGTGYLPICLRLYGAKIGRQVWLNTADITEFDCVSIGDEAQLNEISGPQTHLFEDRVMKIDRVDIGCRVVVGNHAIALPGSRLGNDTRLGSLSLTMSGETLPDNTEWRGSPVSLVPRKAVQYSSKHL